MLRLALAVALVASSVNAQDGSGNKFIPGDMPTLNTEDGAIVISASDLYLNRYVYRFSYHFIYG